MPAGNHPLEIAARKGLGPLSPKAAEVWHGNAVPCVTCGQLVARDAAVCDHCGQDLSPTMVEKMKAHAGPWYVLEHLRPFPGVNLERIVKQIRRGLITETSIVRGPATYYQWRFALETPGLCRYFGKCWNCTNPVGQSETTCQQCGVHLTFEPVRSFAAAAFGNRAAATGTRTPINDVVVPVAPGAASGGTDGGAGGYPTGSELERLRAMLSTTPVVTMEPRADTSPRIAGIKVGWIATGLIAIVVVALLIISQRRDATPPAPSQPPTSVTAPIESTGGN